MAVALDVIAQELQSENRVQVGSFEARTSMSMYKPQLFAPGFLTQAESEKNWKPFLKDHKSLLVALPEPLFSRLSPALVDKQRQTNLQKALSSIQKDSSFLCADVDFAHVDRVMLGHPISACGDWIGLLADIGRGWRGATALGGELEVLVAGVSWMSDNRSIRQFIGPDLSEDDVEAGLCTNLDRRQRLYSALGIKSNVQDMTTYETSGKLNRQTLDRLAGYYLELAETLYGVSGERLSDEEVKLMASRTPQALSDAYPKGVQVLIDAGLLSLTKENVDLEIVARLARQFNRLDASVFRYFFAQWFAQQKYRGNALKCAVFTERTFDRLFDDLNGEIKRRWLPECTAKRAPLPAAYFSHYRIGGMQLLPYNPLSLDALRMKARSRQDVRKIMCPLEGGLDAKEIAALLKRTPLADLNRLVADISSFILLACKNVPAAVSDACKRMGYEDAEDIFAVFSPEAAQAWSNEIKMLAEQGTEKSWLAWLELMNEGERAECLPLHMVFLLQDSWSERQINKGAIIVALAREIYQALALRRA